MALLTGDRTMIDRIIAERREHGHDLRDEVWDGDYIVSPILDVEHQWIISELIGIFGNLCRSEKLGRTYPGINLSDRAEGWEQNYRVPDVAVYLNGNPAINYGTHYQGGPDFAVEILSPGDIARRKRDFYARVGVREFLVVDRDPWALELYRLADGELRLAGTATVDNATTLTSTVLPLTFRLVAGPDRPAIEVARRDVGGETWTI